MAYAVPTAQNIDLYTDAGQTVSRDLADILHDSDDSNVTVTIHTPPSMGHASASDTTISYTAYHNADGVDFFSYMISNSRGASSVWNATIKIGPHAIDPTVNRDPVAPDIQARAFIDAPIVTITPELTDPDGDDINITSAIASWGTILDDTLFTGQIIYRPTPNTIGTDRIIYTVSDGKGGTDNGTITVYVPRHVTWHPRLDHIDNKTVNADNRLSFAVIGYGGYCGYNTNSVRTFGIANAPAGATMTRQGVFSWTPTMSQLGYHDITIIARNNCGGGDWQDIVVRVHPAGTINSNPAAPDITVHAAPMALASIQPSISDPDGNPVEIISAVGATRGTIGETLFSEGIITYAPSDTRGVDKIIYKVSDGNGGISVGTVTVIITNKPLLDPIDNMNITTHDALRFQVRATDPNGDSLNYTLSGHPRGASITSTGMFNWMPDGTQTGTHIFTVTVSDGSHSDSKDIMITVLPKESTNPDSSGGGVVMAPVSDTETGRILEAYMSRGLVVFAGVFPVSGPIPNTIPVGAVGPTSPVSGLDGGRIGGFLRAGIVISVPDARLPRAGLANYTLSDVTDQNDITVFINEIGNAPPVLSSIGDYTINAQDILTFGVSAMDFGGDTISYRLSGAPNGAKISQRGDFSWTPSSSDVGNRTFTIIAYDRHGGTDTETVTVRVLPAGTANRPPIAPNMTATVGPTGMIIMIPAISDPDGDPTRITNATGAAGGTIISSDDSIKYIADSVVAAETITYTVTDARGTTATGMITITIEFVNRPYILDEIGYYNINAQEALMFTVAATNQGGNTLVYLPAGAPAGATISPQGKFSWMPVDADVGNHTFAIAAYDNMGGLGIEYVTVRVLPAGTPNQSPIAPKISIVGSSKFFTITPNIVDPDGDRFRITSVVTANGGFPTLLGESIAYLAPKTPHLDTITYTVEDIRGATSESTITITIR